MTIGELAKSFCNELSRLGYSYRYVRNVSAILAQIVILHSEQNCQNLSPSVVARFIQLSETQHCEDLMLGYCAKLQSLAAKRLLGYAQTGIIADFGFRMPMTYLNPYYDGIVQQYVDAHANTPQQCKGRAWAPKRLASWLLSQNILRLRDATIVHMREYIVDEVKHLKSKTIPSLRVEIRRFCNWAHAKGFMCESFDALFDFRIAIERKIKPAALPEEVALVLNAIDRSTGEGKRNYALVMLGAVTGLRGTDVARLRLGDIDWRVGEIRIAQNKTGKPLALPLTKDVGESLRDYIVNARPESDCDCVFLSLTPPHLPLVGGRSPGMIYINYRKKLGLPSQGFYALRRAVGKNLVTSGTPITTVAQILGHADITNTKQYVALDTVHLKECALSFAGIEPEGCNV